MALSVEFAVPKSSGVETLCRRLSELGVHTGEHKEIPYGHKIPCDWQGERFALVLYYNNKSPLCTKLVCEGRQGAADPLMRELEVKGAVQAATPFAFPRPELKDIPVLSSHVGTDESGKGDLFGSLVVAGVYVNDRTANLLELMGVRDSKLSSDRQNTELARQITDCLPAQDIEVLCISPQKYNTLYEKCGNLNTLLAWGHARVIENLLERHPDCQDVVADQFGSEWVLQKALMPRGRSARVLQTPKGERDIAVAAASVLARRKYLAELSRLSEQCGLILPKGAGANADTAARALQQRSGRESLAGYVKLHFKNIEKLPNN